MKTMLGCLAAFLLLAGAAVGEPASKEGDLVVHDFHFKDGSMLPEIRLHYTTLGAPIRDAKGHARFRCTVWAGPGRPPRGGR